MSLREDLGRRLDHIAWSRPDPKEVAQRDDLFEVLADECIRQMEWARRRCVDHDDDGSATLPLTLAPEDWKP